MTGQPHRVAGAYRLRGMRTTEHFFTVPLDHADPGGETLEVFAREYSSLEHDDDSASRLPWLLFLQGGPGGRGNRVTSLGGWMKEAAKSLPDPDAGPAGHGPSAPVNRQTLPLRGGAAEQAEYLTHFRADSIVRDAELIRRQLGSGPWSIFGQSYGGFCALTYLSLAPEGLQEVLITGGLAPLAGGADRVYRATFPRVEARNREYFDRYPQDRERVTAVARHLAGCPSTCPPASG